MENIEVFYDLISELKKERNERGFWTGKLSSSALATSVAIVAFKKNAEKKFEQNIENGLKWLKANTNSDGGYGDTPSSVSNLSTTLLVYSAIHYCENNLDEKVIFKTNIEKFLKAQNIDFNSENIVKSILIFYGKDLTFSLPIISMMIICGIISKDNLKIIPSLPFELSILPTKFFRFFNLQVVSYAIPALIAVGIYLFKNKKTNILNRFIKGKAMKPALKKLESIMPKSGGFLEATPLTAFVCICLLDSNLSSNVIKNGMKFLQMQQRNDGSFPIDTDLSSWNTTLTIKALDTHIHNQFTKDEISLLRNHLINLQYKDKHPFNSAKAGGWGWTNFSGSVPDVDDTSGAILALLVMFENTDKEILAISNAVLWLTGLQNSDGGFPTFCKGWGRLPFDQSCPDLTGHVVCAFFRVMEVLKEKIEVSIRKRLISCIYKAVSYLQKNQLVNGSWLPLWFGNQLANGKFNPVYGTAKISIYLKDFKRDLKGLSDVYSLINSMLIKSESFIAKQQNEDGSWGGEKGITGSIEETSLAISALSKSVNNSEIKKGLSWLKKEYKSKGLYSSPIGLYFSMLWYDEQMYPKVFFLEALRRNL